MGQTQKIYIFCLLEEFIPCHNLVLGVVFLLVLLGLFPDIFVSKMFLISNALRCRLMQHKL